MHNAGQVQREKASYKENDFILEKFMIQSTKRSL
jgi:hypothetical protein